MPWTSTVAIRGSSSTNRPHGKKGETEKVMVEKARREVHKNVTKLLAAYGESFDNKDHGKNLMHKLLLEGRLMVRRLP